MCDYTDFRRLATHKGYAYHTYSLPQDRSITVTLKGLPNIGDLHIIEELKIHDILVNTCIQINSSENLLAVYRLNLGPWHSLKQLRKIKYLFSSRVYWEKYINNRVAIQCYRCQAFGHTSSNYFKKPRCLKCAGEHVAADCMKSRESPAKCCNCSGDHPANFSGCSAYQKYVEKQNKFKNS